MQILLVDPDIDADDVLRVETCVGGAALTVAGTFENARVMLRAMAPSLLVTNIRLAAFNGIHLILLASGKGTRHLAYLRQHDSVLAREAQAVGAFYERFDRLLTSLPGYLSAHLPAADRRNPCVVDRRRAPRSGRRAADALIVRARDVPAIASRPIS